MRAKTGGEPQFYVHRNDEVAAQRSRWFFSKPSNFPAQTKPAVAVRTDQINFGCRIFGLETKGNVKSILIPTGRTEINFTLGFELLNRLIGSHFHRYLLWNTPVSIPGPVPEFAVKVFQILGWIPGIIFGVHIDPAPIRSPLIPPAGGFEN